MGESGEKDFGENSPAVMDGSFPVTGSGMVLNPMDTVISSKTAQVCRRKVCSLPLLGLILFYPGSKQLLCSSRDNPGLRLHNRAGVEGKRFVLPVLAASMMKHCYYRSLQILIWIDNLWATWTLQTLTLRSFHKHALRIWEQIAPGLGGIDQYFRQQLLSCGKGKRSAQWDRLDFIAVQSHQSASILIQLSLKSLQIFQSA